MSTKDFCARCGFLKEVAHTDEVAREPPFKGTRPLYYCKECFETPEGKVTKQSDPTKVMRRRLLAMFVLGAVVAMGVSFVFFNLVRLSGGCP